MDTSTIINIVLCVLSFILAVISVLTVVITLRQNHKMIDNSTRPYVIVYSATTNFQSPGYYLCVKNFGQSGAVITSFKCDCDLGKYSYNDNHTPFEHLPGTFIAPGQSFICSINPLKLFDDPHPLTFSVEYTLNSKKYKDSFIINIKADSDLVQIRAATKGKELNAISYTLQNIVEKML